MTRPAAHRPSAAARACGRARAWGDAARVRASRASVAYRGCAGQAAVELVALVPLVVAIALAILQALAAGAAAELAGHAAQSAAVAIAEGRDGAQAAQAALPGWARSRMRVAVHGSRVRVRLAPPSLLPGAGERLATSASADAGTQR